MISHQMSILQTRINSIEKARLKEERLVLVVGFCLYSEIFTGDDLRHFVLIKKNGKINLLHFINIYAQVYKSIFI